MKAKTPLSRGRFAQKGLSARSPLDKTTQAMLLRQLYLSLFELRRFDKALAIGKQAAACNVLPDVAHQDVARAALANGDLETALTHLRLAARTGPASRRPFHWWTLGSVLFLAKRYDEANAALERAARWGTRDKPLYRAHRALVQIAKGETPANLQETVNQLVESPCGQGYGRFLLGHLAYAAGSWAEARKYLLNFVRRIEASRPSISIALEGEVEMAKGTLAKMSSN